MDFFEENGTEYLVEEFIPGEDLDTGLLQVYDKVDPYLVARIFHHLAKGLAASHHVDVIHRDLKPTNIMVSKGLGAEVVKITDFGIAKMANEELAEAAEGGDTTITGSQTAVGVLPYMSPEAINTPRDVEHPTDIWSLGAMIYQLLTGFPPFGTGLKAVSQIVSAKLNPIPPFVLSNPQFKPLANEIVKLAQSCLVLNPEDRPTADDLVASCESLCYPVARRYGGIVNNILHGSYGFIDIAGESVFFHLASVYGERPTVRSKVALSKFDGGGANRAHPVVKLR